MKNIVKIILTTLIFAFSLPVYSGHEMVKRESKNFSSMRACVEWIDSIYPNMEWHKKGGPWDMLHDTPEIIVGATNYKSPDGKLRYPVGFQCERRVAGTKGIYFEGFYDVLRPHPAN